MQAQSVPESRSRLRPLYWLVALAFAGGLLVYSLRGVEWKRVGFLLLHANVALVGLLLAISTSTLFLRAMRWRVLLSHEGGVPVSTAFWATCTGYFGNLFLPARAGEVMRSFMINAGSRLSKSYVLTTALSERAVDALVLVSISAVVLLTMQSRPGWFAAAARPFGIIALCAAAGIAILPLLEPFCKRLLHRLPVPDRLRASMEHILEQALLAMRSFHNPARLSRYAAYTAAIWSLDALTTIAGCRALGLVVSPAVAFLLITGLGLGSALPSTPGYVGIYQFVAVTVLVPFGISHTDAIAYILFAQAFQYVLIGSLGLIGLNRYRQLRSGVQPSAITTHTSCASS